MAICRYRPMAYSKGKWVGFPRVHSYGEEARAKKFIRDVKKKYKKASLLPPRLKVKKVCY